MEHVYPCHISVNECKPQRNNTVSAQAARPLVLAITMVGVYPIRCVSHLWGSDAVCLQTRLRLIAWCHILDHIIVLYMQQEDQAVQLPQEGSTVEVCTIIFEQFARN